MMCEDCQWNDDGDCMCFHDTPPMDCPDYESREEGSE